MNRAIKITMKIILSDNTEKTITFKNPESINNIINELFNHTINENTIKYLKDLKDLENCFHCQEYSDTKCYKCDRIVCNKCYEINSHV